MTVATVARYIDRTPEAVRNLLKTGALPVTKLDNRLQVRRIDLDRLLARKTI